MAIMNMVGGGGGGKQAFAFLIVNYPNGASVFATNTSGSKDIDEKKKLFYVTAAGDCIVTISEDGHEDKQKTVSFASEDEGQSKEITMSFELRFSLDIDDWSKTAGNMTQRDDGAIGFYSSAGTARAYLTDPFSIVGYTTLNLKVETAASNNSTIGLSDGQPSGGKSFAASETFNSGTKTVDLTELDTSKQYYLMWQFSAGQYAYITEAYLS